MKLSTEIFNGLLEPLFKNQRVAVMITFFLVFYGGASGPKLPSFIIELFENPIFRVFILSLIVYKGNSNPTLSIMIAVVFTLMMDMINKQKLFEKFTTISKMERYTKGKERFGNLEIELEDSSTENMTPIDGEVKKLPYDEEEIKNNLVTYGSINVDQADILISTINNKFFEQGTVLLTSEEIIGLLTTEGYDADKELGDNINQIITKLEGVQSIIDTQDMMMIGDEMEDEMDDEMDINNYGDIEDNVSIVDTEDTEDINNMSALGL
jgi:hypothetical protein